MILQTITDNKEMITRNSETDFITVTNTDGHLVFMGLRKNIKCFDRLKQVSNRRFVTIPGQTYKIADKTPEPQTKAEPKISPERQAWIDGAYARYLAEQAVKATPAAMPQTTPQPERPKTPEEAWRHDPALRAEFNNNLNAYLAYCKAVESGRCRIFTGGSHKSLQ